MTAFSIPSEFDFGQQFDRLTLQRAMALEPERAVLAMHVDGRQLVTRMHGSGAATYDQRIELPIDRRLGLRVQGHCSCPVGFNCKHVAAALMAFEAHQIRLEKNRAAALADPRLTAGAQTAQTAPPAVRTLRPVVPDLPGALVSWLADMPQAPAQLDATAPPAASAEATRPAHRQLMYVLSAQGTQLQLRIHIGSLRRTGELGSHHMHTSSVADMLRNQPSYLTEADLAVLAALLPLALQATGTPIATHIVMSGRYALAALRAALGSGRAWLLADGAAALPTPPGPAARWLDAPEPATLQWQADTAGQWRTQWRGAAGQALALVLLPEPHVLDAVAATVQPAQLTDAALPPGVAEWLSRMPAVPAPLLPQFIERLQRGTTARHIAVPLPQTQPQQGGDFGALTLVPVLRLSTCVDVSSEAMLHYRYGSAASRNTTLRQASAQLLLRYLPPGAPPVEFHVPVVATESAFVERPAPDGSPVALARFERDGGAETGALRELFGPLEMRPWSLAAGLVMNRLTRVNHGRLQDAAIPPAAEGQPLVWVPQRRDQWPELLAVHLPALQARGWAVEVEHDFPFELHTPDEWALNIDEEGSAGRERSDWFSVGLQVSVDGKAVDLVPLLVSLVQTGWLKLDAALREHAQATGATATVANRGRICGSNRGHNREARSEAAMFWSPGPQNPPPILPSPPANAFCACRCTASHR